MVLVCNSSVFTQGQSAMKLVAVVLAAASWMTESASVNDGVEAGAMMQATRRLHWPVAPDGALPTTAPPTTTWAPSGSYELESSGRCSAYITTMTECSAAAKDLRLSDTSAATDSQNGVDSDPPYCYFESGSLKFNINGTNRGQCKQQRQCLCKKPSVTYLGCYKNQGFGKVHSNNFRSVGGCKAIAVASGKPIFGMTDPQKSRPGLARCISWMTIIPTLSKIRDSECEGEGKFNGFRLGKSYGLAVYSIKAASTTWAPASTTWAPASTTWAPASTTWAPASTTWAPASTTWAPASTTWAPATTTWAPATTTNVTVPRLETVKELKGFVRAEVDTLKVSVGNMEAGVIQALKETRSLNERMVVLENGDLHNRTTVLEQRAAIEVD